MEALAGDSKVIPNSSRSHFGYMYCVLVQLEQDPLRSRRIQARAIFEVQ